MADTHRSRVPGGRRGWGSVAIAWVAVLLLSPRSQRAAAILPTEVSPTKPVDLGDLPRERPVDFGFVLGYGVGGSDEIDTFAYTFTRDMGHELPMSTGIAFSPTELDELYQRLVEMGIDEYPREFDPGGAGVGTSTPFESYHFRMRADGREYEILWDDTDGRLLLRPRSCAASSETSRRWSRHRKSTGRCSSSGRGWSTPGAGEPARPQSGRWAPGRAQTKASPHPTRSGSRTEGSSRGARGGASSSTSSP